MTYFEKIEAYLSGAMNEMEQSIFEQALEEDTFLQKEYEAYKAAQSLFNFTAETLSEQEITSCTAAETVENLINFTAQNLSEQEILGSTETVITQPQAIVTTLRTRKNRTEWLVAASMLFILSLIGARFYNNSSAEMLHNPSEVVVEKAIEPKIETPVEQEKIIPAPVTVITEPEAKLVEKTSKPKYEPAKIRITPKVIPTTAQQPIAVVEKTITTKITPTPSNPIALLTTTAEKIVSGKVFQKGESVVYEAENSVTLKPGFHAKAGTDFVATTNAQKETVTDLIKSEVIDNQQSATYNATNSITLKSGFHAKTGSSFVATTTPPSVSTNSVIFDKEVVEVKADKSITLKAGFQVKAGAEFSAKVKN